MKRYGQVFLLAIGFDLYWTLVVLFREQGLVIWIALAVLAAVITAITPGIRPCAGGVGCVAGRPLGADGADCVHGRVPDAAMDGGAVANVCHRLDAPDPHDHLAVMVADGAGDSGRTGSLPDRRASWGHYVSGADLYRRQLDVPRLAGADAVFPPVDGETTMRNLVLMLALSVFTCTVQAADWLSWRKVGDATLTGGRLPSIPLSF